MRLFISPCIGTFNIYDKNMDKNKTVYFTLKYSSVTHLKRNVIFSHKVVCFIFYHKISIEACRCFLKNNDISNDNSNGCLSADNVC